MNSVNTPQSEARHWVKIVIAAWVLIAAYFVYARWQQIYWFSLGDTDDNMRLMQVRAWLHGQAWSDVRQYRMNPPEGADIHWSRFVDIPIAGLILLFRPFVGSVNAEYVAVTAAPLIPMLVSLTGLSLTVRRLLAPWAFPIAIGVFVFCTGTLSMYMPLRIDHHGWQLAMLPWLIAGIADPKQARGGVTVGIATTVSLIIGLEMLPYLVLSAGILGLRWIFERDEISRLRSYGLSVAGGCALGYLVLTPALNQIPRCDAFSPIWLSAMLALGGFFVLLSLIRTGDWRIKFGVAIIGSAILAGGLAYAWPQCLGRLEGISPELDQLWFSHIREVKPITDQSVDLMIALGFSAFTGTFGALFALVQAYRAGRDTVAGWAAVFLLSLTASLLLFMQSRVGPAVQLLSIPGATALGWAILPKMRASKLVIVRVFGTVLAFAAISGLAMQIGLMLKPEPATKEKPDLSSQANARCATIPGMAPLAKMPAATIFTFVDLSPRLIVLTPHSAIAGPYHRNQQALLDVHHVFRNSPAEAEPIIRSHHARYVLICPNSSESTIYKADRPNGFYAQLSKNIIPNWLKPVALPAGSPFQMWEVQPLKPVLKP
jgi:hypothetical protein